MKPSISVLITVTIALCSFGALSLARCAMGIPKGGSVEIIDGAPSVTVHWIEGGAP